MLIVISPAKKLDFENPAQTDTFTQPELLSDAQSLIKQIKALSEDDIAQLMHLSPALAQLNHERYQTFSTPFNLQNAKQALLAFKGDVYAGMNADTFNKAELTFAQTHLRILSGLYGLLKPLDLMQPYRLEMGTKFATENANNLYEFWGSRITNAVNAALAQSGSETLINLASQEYFKSVQVEHINGQIITPHFKEERDGTLKVIGIYAKRARGLMSRYIIENRITNVKNIQSFTWEGYTFNAAASNHNDWVFSRKKGKII